MRPVPFRLYAPWRVLSVWMLNARLASPRGRTANQTLTLAELEALACLRTSRLLTLYNACVASQESVVFQVLLVFCVHLDEGACDSETQSLALACEAAAVEVCLDVIFLCSLEQQQWLFYHVLQDCRGEIYADVFLVYRDFAGALSEIDTCHSTLATAYCINHFHLSLQLFVLVNIYCLGLLGLHVVLCAVENVEVVHQAASERAFGQHAFNCVTDDSVGAVRTLA